MIDWKNATFKGVYTPSTIRSNGYIHCSTYNQVFDVANRNYRNLHGLCLIKIDERCVYAEIKWEVSGSEDTTGNDEVYPHIYGPLNLDAVNGVFFFPCNEDGYFSTTPKKAN